VKKDKSPLIIIFLTVFIDLVGFGIIIPLSPYLAKEFGASGFQVGLLMSVYSAAQFLFSPFWGRMSDRLGRRPILLISLLGSTLSYLGFAFATDLWVLFVARTFAGIFGANISAASAYIADVTEAKDRSKSMGIIGAAFGLGFILGPAIGGLLSEVGVMLGDTPPFGIGFSALGASLICFFNFVFAYFKLPESLPKEKRATVRTQVSRLRLMTNYIGRPTVGVVMVMGMLFVIAMGQMESTLALFAKEGWGWSLKETSFAFAYVGLMIAITQGYLIRKLIPKYGERKILLIGTLAAAVGMAGIAFADTLIPLGITMTLLALGNGFFQPTTLGTLSLMSGADEQGQTMGVYQSFSALGRIIGPMIGGYLFDNLGQQSPYIVAGFMMLGCFVIVALMYSRIPHDPGRSSVVASH
jgi:MFS family permease